MLTGKKAFEGDNTASVISSIMTGEPAPLRALDGAIPASLDRAVRRCLAKDPDDRWQTSRDLHAELRWIQDNLSSAETAPARARAIGWKRWVIGAIAAVVAITGSWFLAARFGSEPEPVEMVRSSLLPPPGFSFVPYYFAMSPDGTRVAFVAMGPDGGTTLWVRPLSGSAAQQLSGTENALSPFWSPDSHQVGFFADGRLKTVDIAGGLIQVLADTRASWGGSWSSAGTILYTPGGSSPLSRVPAAGGAPSKATKLRSKSQAHRWPWFLPDDKHFLYFVDWSAPGDSQGDGIYAGLLGADDAKPVLLDVRGNAIFVSGHLLYIKDRTLMAQ